jgi:hypothetical protein
MWPLIIAGFTTLLVLLLVLVGVRWDYPRSGLPWSQDEVNANQAGVQISTPNQGRMTWWDRHFGIQRAIGLLFVVGGLWHVAVAWINHNSNATPLLTSNIASGLALAAVGAAMFLLRGARGLAWVAGAIGVWVLMAPQILGFGGPGLAGNEAVWGGVMTVILAVLAGFERRFHQDYVATPTVGMQP